MRKRTLVEQFNLFFIVLSLIFTIGFSWAGSIWTEDWMLERSKLLTAHGIHRFVTSEFEKSEFERTKTGQGYSTFQVRIGHLYFNWGGDDIVRIKIWNSEEKIIWSDRPSLIGREFQYNESLKEAFLGETVSELKTPDKGENQFEQDYNRLLELYVPVRYSPEDPVVAVVEVLMDMDEVFSKLRQIQSLLVFVCVLGFLIMYRFISPLVRKAESRIRVQASELSQAEKKYRSLFENANDAIFVADATTNTILDVNQIAADSLKYTKQELLQKKIGDIFATSPLMKLKGKIDLEKEEQNRPFEYLLATKDGEKIDAEIRSQQIENDSNNLVFQFVVRNITERKRVDASLKLRLKQQEMIARFGEEALKVSDVSKLLYGALALIYKTIKIEYCGIFKSFDTGKKLEFQTGIGWSKGKVGELLFTTERNDHPVINLISDNPMEKESERMTKLLISSSLLRDHGIVNGMMTDISQGGSHYGFLGIFSAKKRNFNSEDGNFLKSVANILSAAITRENAEEQRKKHQLVAISRSRLARIGELSAGVAHSIKNPLHGANNCLEILQKKITADPVTIEMFQLLKEGLNRIDNVTSRLLQLSRKPSNVASKAIIDNLIMDALKFVEIKASKRKVTLVANLTKTPPLMLDPDRFVEGLLNLVDNALDACSEGDKITLNTYHQSNPDNKVIVIIKDTGEGIKSENLNEIEEPFFTTKPVGEGTGLGLAITRTIIEELGGELQIESEVGLGTEVQIVLPVNRVEKK